MEISREEFSDWKSNAVTQHVLEVLNNYKEDYLHAMRAYVKTGDSVSAARCEGTIEGLEQLLEIEYSDPAED